MKRLCLGMLLFVLLTVTDFGNRANAMQPLLQPIQIGDLWGYANEAGEIVIEPKWQEAEPFSETAAFVVTPEGWDALIDITGNYIFSPSENVIIDEFDFAYRIIDLSDGWCEGFFDKKVDFIKNQTVNIQALNCGAKMETVQLPL